MIHGDPLDRLLIATVLQYDAELVSVDSVFSKYNELNGRLIGFHKGTPP